MSLVYQRFFTLSLPTVAAILGILWLRNRRKGRHPLADKSCNSFPNKAEEENHRDKLILVCDTNVEDNITADNTCMSVEDTVIKTIDFGSTLNTTCESTLCKNSEDSFIGTNTKKSISAVPSTEKSINDIKTESGLIDQLNPTEFKEIHNSSEKLYKIESKDIAGIEVKLEEIHLPVVEEVNSEIKTCSVLSTECEEKNIQVLNIQEGIEEEMKKEKEQLKENLSTLELDKMKETGQLAEKLASLELDQMKMDERKSGSERDSANHSPSEIMLASPSISNFSDAHSEGSSDSGKGQSDGATSPSRTPAGTPAGGSSLAGDQAPSVYEFILPQVIVGRLIGRHGVFLNEIKTQTHTNIFIKRHPDSNKLKVCAIEGTQQDIDKALAKIRQKFPLRRFPQLTLEKVSFVQVNPLPPLKPEDFHLQLVEGVNNDVVLSSLISAAHFFLQQPCHPSYSSLAALNSIMTQIYSSGEAPILETPVNYAVCAAPAMEGWYRAQIVQVEEDGQHCTVRYLDYGGYSRIAASELRQIRGDLLALPFQAVECYLANVAPPPGEDWSEEARMFVHSLTCGQILHAQVYDYAEDGAPLVYLYSSIGTQVVLINEELVVHGYAVISESGSTCGTTSEDGGRTDEEGAKSEKEAEE